MAGTSSSAYRPIEALCITCLLSWATTSIPAAPIFSPVIPHVCPIPHVFAMFPLHFPHSSRGSNLSAILGMVDARTVYIIEVPDKERLFNLSPQWAP